MHPGNASLWRNAFCCKPKLMKIDEVYPLPPTMEATQNVHKRHRFGGSDQPSIRQLLCSIFINTSASPRCRASPSTYWCTRIHPPVRTSPVRDSPIFTWCPSHGGLLSQMVQDYKDTWLKVGPAWLSPWMQMCDSVQSQSLLGAASICLCANVSWFLGISGPGSRSDSEFELTVCHCHNIKATIRHTDTSVRSSSSSSSTLWHVWVFMFLLSCPDLSALSMIILLSNCSQRGGARMRWRDPLSPALWRRAEVRARWVLIMWRLTSITSSAPSNTMGVLVDSNVLCGDDIWKNSFLKSEAFENQIFCVLFCFTLWPRSKWGLWFCDYEYLVLTRLHMLIRLKRLTVALRSAPLVSDWILLCVIAAVLV